MAPKEPKDALYDEICDLIQAEGLPSKPSAERGKPEDEQNLFTATPPNTLYRNLFVADVTHNKILANSDLGIALAKELGNTDGNLKEAIHARLRSSNPSLSSPKSILQTVIDFCKRMFGSDEAKLQQRARTILQKVKRQKVETPHTTTLKVKRTPKKVEASSVNDAASDWASAEETTDTWANKVDEVMRQANDLGFDKNHSVEMREMLLQSKYSQLTGKQTDQFALTKDYGTERKKLRKNNWRCTIDPHDNRALQVTYVTDIYPTIPVEDKDGDIMHKDSLYVDSDGSLKTTNETEHLDEGPNAVQAPLSVSFTAKLKLSDDKKELLSTPEVSMITMADVAGMKPPKPGAYLPNALRKQWQTQNKETVINPNIQPNSPQEQPPPPTPSP